MDPNQSKYYSVLHKHRLLFISIIAFVFCPTINLSAQNQFDHTKIGIAFSEKSWKEIYSSDQNYFFIQDWEMFFLDRKISYSVFTDVGLDDFDFEDMDVMILPGIEYLSDDAIQNIKDFISSGKSVFILGNLGIYKSQYRKRLSSVLGELFRINPIKKNDPENLVQTIKLNVNNPFIQEFNNQKYNIRNNVDLYYARPGLELSSLGFYSLPDSINKDRESAVIYGSTGKSRFAWMGFQISQIVDGIGENSVAEETILNILKFLSDKPLLNINNFPAQNNHAIIFLNKLKDGNKFSELIHEYNIPRGLLFDNFVTPENLEKKDFNLKYFSNFGDFHLIYNQIDYLNKSAKFIDEIFQNAKKNIELSTVQDEIGIFDESAFVSELSNDSIKFDKFSFRMNNNLIFKIHNNDANISFKILTNIFNRDGIFDEKFRCEFSGEHALVFSFVDEFNPEQIITSDEYKTLQISLMKNDFWVTTFNKMIDWYELKQNISVMVNSVEGEEAIEIEIINNNPVKVDELGLNLILPKEFINPSVSEPGLRFIFDYKTHQYKLIVENLNPNQEKRIIISE